MHTLDRSRPTIGAQAVGIAQGAIDYAGAYMKQRHAFGAPIADLQGLRFMLADMAMRNEAARALVYRACAMVDDDPTGELTKFGAMAKAFASDASMSITVDAVQLLGGYGYTKDFPVERFLRDAKVTQIYEGTNQVQRVVIARELLKHLRERGRPVRRNGVGARRSRPGQTSGAARRAGDKVRTGSRIRPSRAAGRGPGVAAGGTSVMAQPVIIEAVRTPIGKRNGWLSGLRAPDILGAAQVEVVKRAGIDPASVEQVVGGCVTQAGEQGFNVTRTAWLLSRPALRGRRHHGRLPVRLVAAGQPLRQQPHRRRRRRHGDRLRRRGHEPGPAGGQRRRPASGRAIPDDLPYDMPDQFTAAERIAKKYGITREDVDWLGLESQKKAAVARGRGPLRPRDRLRRGARSSARRARAASTRARRWS